MSAPVIVWLILSLIWGSTWLFIKLGLQDLPPFTFAGVRFVIAAAILLVVIAVRRMPLPRARRDWGLIALTGFMSFSVNYGLLFWGEQRTSSGLAAILQTIIPAFGLIIAHYYLPDERITLLKVCGIVLGIAGVALIFSDQASVEGTSALAGSAAIVVGAFSVAYSNVLVKARARHIEPAVLAAGQMICGLVPLLLIGVTFEGNPFAFRWTPLALASLLYLALVGSAIAFLLFYWLVRNMDVTNTMLIPLVTPPIAVFLGWLVLHEGLTWRTAAGALGIMSGIALIVTRKKKELAAAATVVVNESKATG
ncbi:MAG TPA: EamA family transporter [Pyrinomonadaceae bacterium]|jgi:drug/metabolite transporter (DMT)-like permease|nr:EamA family transporter [Pyrinomonadaceae bacterium]